MSEENKKNNQDKSQEDLNKLAEALRAKYGLSPTEKGVRVVPKVSDHQNNKEESNYDLMENKKTTTLESKYGLKPMDEIIPPKSPEEKQRELEEYIKRNNHIQLQKKIRENMLQEKNKDHISMYDSDRPLPTQYKWFEDIPGYKPEVNIGQKWANMLEAQVRNETELNASLRKGGFIYQSWKKGKLGIDKYLLIVGFLGLFLIPTYIYNRHKKYKEFLRQERGLKPGEELDLENGQWDIDDISFHKHWHDDKEERRKNYESLMRKKEIRKLQEQIYGKDAFGSSIYKN